MTEQQVVRRATSEQARSRKARKATQASHARLTELLSEHLRFETMLSRLSATFVSLRATEIDSHVEAGLQLLVEHLGIDRSSVAQFSDDGRELLVTHSYTRPPFAPYPKENVAPLLPWYVAKIRQGELLRFTRLPEELPPEAVSERAFYRRPGLPRSHVMIPFQVGNSVLGGIGFATFDKTYDWPGELVQSLKLAGEIFANALARKRSEEKETRLRDQLVLVSRVSLIGELAAAIAHEVNQPLCAIISNAQTAQRMLADGADLDLAEVREALDDVIRDGQRASAVIARIRGLLKKTPEERVPINLNELIREVIPLTRWEMNRRSIAVQLELAEHLPCVLGDRVQLQQVILNLMTNGADAMESMAPQRRKLVIRSEEKPAEGVVITVRDFGVGIDPHRSERLFDSFFTTKPGGMGLGLAICKSILEAHDGRISARPNDDGGSTFQFTLAGIPEGTS